MNRLKRWNVVCGVVCAVGGLLAGERVLPLATYRDRMEGGWIGQMIGVSWGTPTEFKWRDSIIPSANVPAWRSDFPLTMAYGNDDLYVEMTFLRTLEEHGLDVSIRQAGIDFANSEYGVWCANRAGRTNLRRGVAPPDSSHPRYNACPNDIDYQIEADYAGLIAPGCPQEAIRLGNIFGRLMNYGDGVWAGQFVGALYAEAFFTSDVNKLLDAGLAAIPAESDYAGMVRNVRAWHARFPNDWVQCWNQIRENYSARRNKSLRDTNGDIDVRLNGAAIVLGLLYGRGDLDHSMELSMRCGWDSDCNPSNVGGILMTACGRKALPAKYVEKLDWGRKFSYTAYNLTNLFAVCEQLARQVVVRHGGRIERAADGSEQMVIPDRKPVPDPFVPSWKAPPAQGLKFTAEEMAQQKHALKLPDPKDMDDPDPTVRVQKALDALAPGWKTSPNGPDMHPGYEEFIETVLNGQLYGVIRTHPPRKGVDVTLSTTLKVPRGNPRLHFKVANSPNGGDFRLIVRVNGAEMLSTIVGDTKADWRSHLHEYTMSLEPWEGQTATIELVDSPNGWMCEAAQWSGIEILSNSDQ